MIRRHDVGWFAVLAAVILAGPVTCQAQLSSILREAVEAGVKGASKAARTGVKEGVENSAPTVSRLLRRGAVEAAEQTTQATARSAVRVVSREAVEAIAKHGETVCQPVLQHFGDDGARALAQLSSTGGEQLAGLAPELARNPYAGQWLSTIAQHGDAAVAWLWKRKASVAVGTVATAIVLKPEAFLEASEHVATTAITTAGSQVAAPLIVETGEALVKPLVAEIAPSVVRPLTSTLALVGCVVSAAGMAWLCWRLPRPGRRAA